MALRQRMRSRSLLGFTLLIALLQAAVMHSPFWSAGSAASRLATVGGHSGHSGPELGPLQMLGAAGDELCNQAMSMVDRMLGRFSDESVDTRRRVLQAKVDAQKAVEAAKEEARKEIEARKKDLKNAAKDARAEAEAAVAKAKKKSEDAIEKAKQQADKTVKKAKEDLEKSFK
eukprot:TRINITY_DN28089_c0_g1_i1.p1 TRINITY_DN28089_c0_g1~~TRINITY_DN28089_c0_g1_i1.p1  ORF type:complete len:173 (+),score=64.35 TRINITY_DN28089_c0_g1_i1:72-590(+)